MVEDIVDEDAAHCELESWWPPTSDPPEEVDTTISVIAYYIITYNSFDDQQLFLSALSFGDMICVDGISILESRPRSMWPHVSHRRKQ